MNRPYSTLISSESKFSKENGGNRTPDSNEFEKYLKFCCEHRETYMNELLCSARRKQRWKQKKKSQSFYSLTAQSLCGEIRSKDDTRQVHLLCVGDLGGGSCSWSGIQNHKCHLSFKRLLRECASRGPVFVMDEYGTSFSCPGCGGEMVTIDKRNRIRTCGKGQSTNENACSLNLDDRDENSAVQMILGAVCRLVHGVRPPHLMRPTPAAATTSSSSSSSS